MQSNIYVYASLPVVLKSRCSPPLCIHCTVRTSMSMGLGEIRVPKNLHLALTERSSQLRGVSGVNGELHCLECEADVRPCRAQVAGGICTVLHISYNTTPTPSRLCAPYVSDSALTQSEDLRFRTRLCGTHKLV